MYVLLAQFPAPLGKLSYPAFKYSRQPPHDVMSSASDKALGSHRKPGTRLPSANSTLPSVIGRGSVGQQAAQALRR